MFDIGSGGSDAGNFDSGSEGTPERRQYTLKGVEADTIKLMRYAANKEGMKIGSWVSLRMREAAERALAKDSATLPASENLSCPNVDNENHYHYLLGDCGGSLKADSAALEDRLSRIEKELQEVTSVQRTILNTLLIRLCK